MKKKVKTIKRKKFDPGGSPFNPPREVTPGKKYTSTIEKLNKASTGLGIASGMAGGIIEDTMVDTDKMKTGAKGAYTGFKMAGDALAMSPEPISNLVGQALKILTPLGAGIAQKIKAKNSDLDPEYEQGNSNLFTTGHFGFAYGGKVPFDNSKLIQFKGPKHENGGIPIDFDKDGIEESEVEGGETMKNGYIFSDQLGYDKKNNPTDVKKKVKTTFADKSKSIENKFKGRFDEASQFTKELEMKKLQNENEVVRKKVDSKKQKGFERKQFSGGGNAQLVNQFLKAANVDTLPLENNPTIQPQTPITPAVTTTPKLSWRDKITQWNNSRSDNSSPFMEGLNNFIYPGKIPNIKYPVQSQTNTQTPQVDESKARTSNQAYADAYDKKFGTKPGTTQSKSTSSTKKVVQSKPKLQYDPEVAKWQQEMLNLGYKDSDMGFVGTPDGKMGKHSSALLARTTKDEYTEKDKINPVPLLKPKIEKRKLPEFSFTEKPEDLFTLTKQQLRKDRKNENKNSKDNSFGNLTQGDKIQLGAAFANYGSKLAQSMKKLDKEPVWTNQNESAAIAQIENLKTDTRQAKNDLNRSVEAGKQTIAANSRSVGAQLANNQSLSNKEMSARNELSIKEMEFENNKKLQLANMLNQFGESNKQERKQSYINKQQNKAARDMMRAEANNKLESALTALGQGKNQAQLNTQQFNMIKEMSKEFGYGTDYKSFLKDINGAGLLEYLGQPLDVKAAGKGNAATTAAKVKAEKEKREAEKNKNNNK